ncbi:copper resistance CopC/CopD family protein [Brevibacillus sp. GCM10020057]|uniref:copper resistance CopC/CopD family protein n=1 Tax=Brevibacillus sp. GCM10020057 TaxID=3317327 RepID=UPI003632E6B2
MKRYMALLWLALFLVLGSPATTALAHAGLIGSSPKDGELLKDNPGQISLHFTETLEPDLVDIRLYDWNGEEVRLNRPALQPGDASVVRAELPDLQEGTYVAIVSVVSEDGHPVEERVTFSIGQKSASVADPTQPKTDNRYLLVYRYLTQGLILLGGGLYLLARQGARSGLPDFSRLLGIGRQIGWGLMLVGLVFLWFLYDESLPAVSLTDALWQGNGDILKQSSFAVMLLVSLGLLLLLAIPNMVTGWYLFCWGALVGTQAFGGHAWGISPVWLSLLLRLLHVMTVSLWMGALVYLLLAYRHMEQDKAAFRAFFLKAVTGASLLAVLTGLVMLFVQTDAQSIWQSSLLWSKLLFGKVLLVCAMLLLAYLQRKRWRKGEALRVRLLRWEIILGLLALLAGIWMSQTSYPTAGTTDTHVAIHDRH